MAAPSERPSWWLLAALLLLELLGTLADLLLGPHAQVPPEALYNARAGLLVACGHGDALWEMQYRAFCGGCSAEALLAAPSFLALGPSVLAWRLVPAALHLGVVGAGAAWAWRSLGPWMAALWVTLMMGAPGFYRELALTGFGNHAEASAFTLGAAALLVLGGARRRVQLLSGAAAGLLAGLGLWFCYTAAHALPALLALALARGRWRLGALLLAAPLGASPWWLYHRGRANEIAEASMWWTSRKIAEPGVLADWLLGGFVRAGLWPPSQYGDLGAFPALWWGLLWVMAGLGLLLGLRAARERPGLLYPGLAWLGLLAAYALRFDLWDDSTEDLAAAAFLLRYRAPLLPLLAMNLVAAVALVPRGQRLMLGLALSLALSGLTLRMGQWSQPAGPALAPLTLLDGEPDRSLPAGRPPVRLRRQMGRAADVEAAARAIAGHQDPLPACRALHVQELGRRLGLGLAGGAWPGWGEALGAAWTQAELEQGALLVGLRAGVEEGGASAPAATLAAPQVRDAPAARAALEALKAP
ncbi:MAG: hypothetical protein H6741_01530 [Alphaproteobacteria bacterium]|nr:hypothetical protein [Alphaproteobacteria bacterium]